MSWKCGEGSSLSPCPSPFPFLLLLLPSLCIFCSLCSDDSAPAPADSPLLQGTGISFTPCLSEPLNWVSCRVCAAVLCGRYVLTPWASVALFSLSECASSLPCGLCWGRCRGGPGLCPGGQRERGVRALQDLLFCEGRSVLVLFTDDLQCLESTC